MRRLYLAGPIFGCLDLEARDWRDTVTNALAGRWECVNPMRRDYRGREDDFATEIVSGDLADIASCDALFVFAWKASWGTAMEIRAAIHELHKPVHAVVIGPVSPWLRYHATALYPNLGDACLALARLADGEIEPTMRCPECDGSGTLAKHNLEGWCSACYGMGKIGAKGRDCERTD